MALTTNLLISWNHDTVTGSNNSGEFTVADVAGSTSGEAINFASSDDSFILKEEVKIKKLLHYENLEGSETINIKGDEDARVSDFLKPSSMQLFVENSMYQLISDDILKLFSSIDGYTKFLIDPKNKYFEEYQNNNLNTLKLERKKYFDKVLNNPDIEKYIEFYKWLDSSLGEMLKQLMPENSINNNGLKVTIEDHILDRSKYTHQIPLTVKPNLSISGGVTVIKHNTPSSSLSRSLQEPFLTGNIEDVVSTTNVLNKNYSKNYEIFQTAGKQFNNTTPGSKSVFKTNFSSGDGLSELNRHETFEEFSVYNELNQRAKTVRAAYNISQAADRRIDQGVNSDSDFEDNAFIQRNVPYTASNYYKSASIGYEAFPREQLQYNRQNNILLEDSFLIGEKVFDDAIVESPIEYNFPIKHRLKLSTGLQDIDIYSSFSNEVNYFSKDVLESNLKTFQDKALANYFETFPTAKDLSQTFYEKIKNLQNIFIKNLEITEHVFPRKSFLGLGLARTKPNYEEVSGSFFDVPINEKKWSDNSYNNNATKRRSFWKDALENRKTTSGANQFYGTGSFNCLNFPNVSESVETKIFDKQVDFTFSSIGIKVSDTNFKNYESRRGLQVSFYGTSYLGGILRWRGYIPFSLILSGNKSNSIYSLDSNNTVLSQSGLELSGAGPNYIYQFDFQDFSPVIGDLGPLPSAENIKFINTNFYATPKPVFIFNNLFGLDVDYNNSALTNITPQNPKLTASFYVNDSYQNELDANLKPFYNSYEDYFTNIKHKSQAHSIIPEYTLEANEDFFKAKNYGNLTINGNEKYDEINNISSVDDFVIDFKKFINPDSNKIKITLSAIKKLLPYNGFYPNQRVPQIVTAFSSSYLGSTIKESQKIITDVPKEKQIQALIQPLFAPGILNNTIKAGLAVDYPCVLTSSTLATSYNLIYSSSARFTGDPQTKINNLNKRIPFEAILNPLANIKNTIPQSSSLVYLDPLSYSLVDSDKRIIPKVDVSSLDIEGFKYLNTISNFISEIPNFFLRNSQLTYFVSDKESNFKQVKNGEIYQMKVNIAKADNFSMFTTGSGNLIPVESLFGPPCMYDAVNASNTGEPIFSASCYQPFAPSYFRKNANVVIAYTASADEKPTLSKILSFPNYNFYEDNSQLTVPANLNATASTSFVHRMPLQSSLHLTDILETQKLSFDSITGRPIAASNAETSDKKWVIKTKFETPLINYVNTVADPSLTSEDVSRFFLYGLYNPAIGPDVEDSAFFTSKTITNYSSINGIWNRLGEIPEDLNSIQITLSDEGFENSLLDVCGFKKETKSISQLAENKVISEAVVILPFIERTNVLDKNLFTEIKSAKGSRDDLTKYKNKKIFGIKISENEINSFLKTSDYKALNIYEIKKILESNEQIDKTNFLFGLMNAMVNYNIPPQLNWIFDRNIEPFYMYIAEFSHTLSKQDLANIWQGTLPQIGLVPEEQIATIEQNLFDNTQLLNILKNNDIKAKIFKIKKRANTSYEELKSDIEDFKKYSAPKQPKDVSSWYSYNWPYDYFSLVELVNVQMSEIYDTEVTEPIRQQFQNALEDRTIIEAAQNAIQEAVSSGNLTLGGGIDSIQATNTILNNINNNLNNNKNNG